MSGESNAPTQAAFWSQLIAGLESRGFRSPYQRDKSCRLSLARTRSARVVLVAPTGDGRHIACKLDLLRVTGVGAVDPEVVMRRLFEQRDQIEAELRLGALEWGGRSPSRIYLYRELRKRDRRAWSDAREWLVEAAVRFREVFEPRLLEITRPSAATRLPRRAASRRDASPVAEDAAVVVNQPVKDRPHHLKRAPAPAAGGGAPVRAEVADRDNPSIEQDFRRLADEFGLDVKYFPDRNMWQLLSRDRPNGKPVYRYATARWWDPKKEPRLADTVAWVLLNPLGLDSTEPRQRRSLAYCINRSKGKHDGLVIVNLFAYRADTPKGLKALPRDQAVGPVNDQILRAVTEMCAVTVAAWGGKGHLHRRSNEVKRLIPNLQCVYRADGRPVTTKDGEPCHPARMLPKDGRLGPLP
jgi:hypothetical protein